MEDTTWMKPHGWPDVEDNVIGSGKHPMREEIHYYWARTNSTKPWKWRSAKKISTIFSFYFFSIPFELWGRGVRGVIFVPVPSCIKKCWKKIYFRFFENIRWDYDNWSKTAKTVVFAKDYYTPLSVVYEYKTRRYCHIRGLTVNNSSAHFSAHFICLSV